jgi:hypothetical protein
MVIHTVQSSINDSLCPGGRGQLKRECDTVLIERHKDLMQVECKTYLADDKRDGTFASPLPMRARALALTSDGQI